MFIIPTILSGGSGTRLWPKSRRHFPKQFLRLLSHQSIFQDTIDRVLDLGLGSTPIIVANEKHRFLVKDQIEELGIDKIDILLEPIGRNTAPAVCLAAIHALKSNPGRDPVLLVLPSDHLVADIDKFKQDIESVEEHMDDAHLVTFGVVPKKAETGFGYIKKGKTIGNAVFTVEAFKEKPDHALAKEYFSSGEYLWNSGIFMFRAQTYLTKILACSPEIYQACAASYGKSYRDLSFIRLGGEEFEHSPSDSIDYAIMELSSADSIVIQASFRWNDIGSWSAIKELSSPDNDGNVLHGDVVVNQSNNCFVEAESRLVCLLGMKNTVVIDTKDSVLVASLDDVQSVGEYAKRLQGMERSEADFHREVHRPWGKYDSVDMGDKFQVKRITVNPGGVLSSQRHKYRAEHWVVVSGRAEVTRDGETMILEKNQSTYIPSGAVHRLSNPFDQDLQLIEVQTGDYLGEDDIERFEDVYGRVEEGS